MAAKKAKQKAKPKPPVSRVSKPAKKAVAKAVAKAKTAVKSAPKKTQKVVKPAAKRVSAPKLSPAKVVKATPAKVSAVKASPAKVSPPQVGTAKVSAPRAKLEPPPMDHGATIGPLYLGAGHGHLARAVDKSWLEALERYRKAVDEAVSYEGRRTPMARATMVLTFARQVQTLMNNLAARVQAIAAEVHNSAMAEAQRESARSGGKLLVAELKRLNDTYGSMSGPEGIAPNGEESLSTGMAPQLDQLQRAYFNNIARWADLERSLL